MNNNNNIQPQQPQQQRTVEELWSIFDQAVQRIFVQWTALALAVENGWGGRSSREKAEEMRQDVLDVFLQGKQVYPDMITMIFEDVLSNDLNTVAEDGSYREVAELCIQCYNLISNNQIDQVIQLLGPEMGPAIDRCIRPEGADDDSDSDSGSEMGDDSMEMEEEKPKKNEPDADGWITVPGRRRN
eukprot:gene12032-14073_t